MKELRKKNPIIKARYRKVWWRRNWLLVLPMVFSFIVAVIFLLGIFWYVGEVDKLMFEVEPWQIRYVEQLKIYE